MSNFGEFHVYSCGSMVERVIWRLPSRDGTPNYDLTGMAIAKVERSIVVGEIPKVVVTFFARLVEHESNEEQS